ncbi:MAG: hypothetical protein KBS59_05695, partial [Clostridiales bacterium]|nr:hypothetical protein [Clostridiales bacterium]
MKRKILLILMSALIIAASLSVSSLASDDLTAKNVFDLIDGTYTSGACKLEKSVDTIDGVNNFIVITDISNYTSQMFPLSHSLSVSSNGNTCVFEYNNSDRALMSANNAEYSEEKTTLTFVVENGKIDSITVAGSECFFTKPSAYFPDGEYAYCNFDGEYKIPDGTSEHPWDITSYNINYETQYVFAYVESDSLNICGYGDMKDYDDPSSRPWNDGIENVTSIFVGDDIFYIGSNAFKNAGSAMSDDDWFFCAVPEDVKAIG